MDRLELAVQPQGQLAPQRQAEALQPAERLVLDEVWQDISMVYKHYGRLEDLLQAILHTWSRRG